MGPEQGRPKRLNAETRMLMASGAPWWCAASTRARVLGDGALRLDHILKEREGQAPRGVWVANGRAASPARFRSPRKWGASRFHATTMREQGFQWMFLSSVRRGQHMSSGAGPEHKAGVPPRAGQLSPRSGTPSAPTRRRAGERGTCPVQGHASLHTTTTYAAHVTVKAPASSFSWCKKQ